MPKTMSKITIREPEPLYIIIVHDSSAEQKLLAWYRNNPTAQVSVQGMRMRVYDQRSLSLFQVTWSNKWDTVVIWDTWLKRHINIE
jgi:hypothetical protein